MRSSAPQARSTGESQQTTAKMMTIMIEDEECDVAYFDSTALMKSRIIHDHAELIDLRETIREAFLETPTKFWIDENGTVCALLHGNTIFFNPESPANLKIVNGLSHELSEESDEEDDLIKMTRAGLVLSTDKDGIVMPICSRKSSNSEDLVNPNPTPDSEPQGIFISAKVVQEFRSLHSVDCLGCSIIADAIRIELNPPIDNEVPERDAVWCRKNSCPMIAHDGDCPVYALNDWIFRMERDNPSVLCTGFFKNITRTIDAATLAISLERAMTKRQRLQMLGELRAHPYVIYATRIEDELLLKSGLSLSRLAKLYAIRVKFGLNGDYGCRDRVDGLQAEDDDVDTTGIWEKFTNALTSISNLVPSSAKNAMKALRDVIKSIVDKIFNIFDWMFSLVSNSVTKLIKIMKDKIIDLILKDVVPAEFLAQMRSPEFLQKMTKLFTIVVVVGMSVGGFIGSGLCQMMIYFLAGKRQPDDSFEAQADIDPIAILMTLMVSVIGVRMSDAETLRKRCLQLTAAMAGGTVLARGVSALFLMLPTVLRQALVYKFASRSYREKFDSDQWKMTAQALLVMSRTSSVIGSKIYSEKISECMREGSRLMREIADKDVRLGMAPIFGRLLNVETILVQKRNTGGTRRLPFSFHFSAAPGVGKTLLATEIVKRCFDRREEDIYFRPVSDEFWSGFLSQPIVIMDEFMVGNQDDKTRVGKEYLNLVSTNQFQPPLASVDNVSVGIKGSVACPDAVMTVNNTPYNRPPEIDAHAFQRRREFVLEARVASDAKMKGPNAVDLGSYSRDELVSANWAEFRFLPGVHSSAAMLTEASPWTTFDVVCREIKTRFVEHKRVCEAIAQSYGGGMIDNVDPEALLNETLRESFSLPKKAMTITEALFGAAPMEAQGPSDGEEGPSQTHVEVEAEAVAEGEWQKANIFKKTKRRQRKLARDSGMVMRPTENRSALERHIHKCCSIFEWHIGYCEKGLLCRKCGGTTKCVKPVTYSSDEDMEFLDAAPNMAFDMFCANGRHGENGEVHSHMCPEPRCTRVLNHKHGSYEYQLSDGPVIKIHASSHRVWVCPDHANVREKFEEQGSQIVVDPETHSGIDPNMMHRHVCAAKDCQRQVAHRHPEHRHGRVYCSGCVTGAFDPQNKEAFLEREVMMAVNEEVISRTRFETHLNQANEIAAGRKENRISATYEEFQEKCLEQIHKQGRFLWATSCSAYTGEEDAGLYAVLKKSITSGFTITVAYTVLITVYNYLKKKNETKIEFGAQSRKPTKFSRAKNAGKPVFRRGVYMESQAQSEVEVVPVSFGGKVVNAIPLRERWMLTYQHALCNADGPIPEGTPMEMCYKGKTYRSKFSTQTTISCGDLDMAVFQFENVQLQQFKDVTKRFVTEFEKKDVKSLPFLMRTEDGTKYATATIAMNREYNFNGHAKMLPEAWRYRMTTNPGDCGTPLIVSSGPLVGKVLGMHVAGTGDKVVDPQGLATIVTKELLDSCMKPLVGGVDMEPFEDETMFFSEGKEEDEEFCSFVEPDYSENSGSFSDEKKMEILLGSLNVVKVEAVQDHQVIYLPNKSKIKPSFLQGELSQEVKKHIPILTSRDSRAKNKDPIFESVKDTLSTDHPKVDEEQVAQIFQDIFKHYNESLEFGKIGRRRLTFEQACRGIPGELCSLRTDTSAGYPLVYTTVEKGKKEYVWFDEFGEMHYTPAFKTLVLEKVEEMQRYDGSEPIDHVFLGYLKDETVSDSKLEDCRIRMIYANDLICLVAFRMVFGTILSAFNNSGRQTPTAIGLNQYSYDMNAIHGYLVEVGNSFIAGDYKSFDKRMHPVFRDYAYGVLFQLAETYGVTKNEMKFLLDHETKAPAQVGRFRFWTKSNHMSGCFFTTIINCLVNEAYFRHCFERKYPHLKYSEHIRNKFVGDDHILCCSEEANWTPIEIGELMKAVGQEYTSAYKGQPLEDHQCSFKEITFLGSHPRKLFGRWTGAMKKDTLFETVQWTRDHDLSMDQIVNQMIECASQWDEDFFESYVKELIMAYEDHGRPFPFKGGYFETAKAVANRDSCSGYHFSGFNAEGPDEPPTMTRPAPSVNGLTTMETQTQVASSSAAGSSYDAVASLALNEAAATMEYGPGSAMFRTSFVWKEADVLGTVIGKADVPFGLLSLANTNNVQNMPFQRFIYFLTDVELTFQLNGTPFQQGCALVYFYPLWEARSVAPGIYNAVACREAKMLKPDTNTTTTLNIPFKFYRSALNSYAGGLGDESLGALFLQVISPLVSNVTGEDVTITMYTKFNSKFTIPRPYIPPEFDALSGQNPDFVRGVKMPQGRRLNENELEFQAQGMSVSKQQTTNNYTVGNIAGDMPIQTGVTSTATNKTDATVDATVTPMDNPPLGGGSIPTHLAFSSMSKSNGVEPTVGMQFHQAMMHREHGAIMDPQETTIEFLMGQRCMLNFQTNYTWTTSQVEGEVIMTIPLNSIMAEPTPAQEIQATFIPYNLALLNYFKFFRCDFEISLLCVRTKYHSGRLCATVAYGAPPDQVNAENKNLFLNQILEFNDENDWAVIKIPYNAGTEWLRTYEGRGAPDQIQNYSLGTLMITVQNVLRATSTVASSVSIIPFVSLRNVRVYEMATTPGCDLGEFATVQADIPAARSSDPMFFAQGPNDEVVAIDPQRGDEEPMPVTSLTAEESDVMPSRPCVLELGRKFEYCITNVVEVLRRHTRIPDPPEKAIKTLAGTQYIGYRLTVRPRSPFMSMYAGWAGHMKYRIFLPNVGRGPVLIQHSSSQNEEVDLTKDAFFYSITPDFKEQMTRGTDSFEVKLRPGAIVHAPTEVFFPITTQNDFIDVSAPFNTHFNFLPTNVDFPSIVPRSSGSLVMAIPREAGTYSQDTFFFEAVGDDFRPLIFRPPAASHFNPIQTIESNIDGFTIGTWTV
jgi:hypothetical protein